MPACPHCELGQFEREVLETMDFFYDRGVALTKQQGRLMAAIFGKKGVVRTESLINAIWYDCPNGEPEYAENIIKVHLSKIRKKAAAAGLLLRIQPFWGVGYAAERPE